VRIRGKLRSRGVEKYHLGLQVFKGVRVLSGLLLGDEIVPVNVTGVKELVGGLLVLGIGQKLLSADFSVRGTQRRAQPLEFITGFGSLSCGSGGTPAATQGQDKNNEIKSTEKVHGTTLLFVSDYRKTSGSARWENWVRRITAGL
jgi:hypothetical protein